MAEYNLTTTSLPGGIRWQRSDVGVPGGIPTRTTIYQTLTSSATAAQINTALANCPDDQVVYLSAGTYTINDMIEITNSRVTLRGAGMGQTIINVGGSWTGGYAVIYVHGTGSFDPNVVGNWTAGYTQGSTSITLSSVAGLSIGDIITLDQLNSGYVEGSGTGFRAGDRARSQVVRVEGIAGNVLTISPRIYANDWESGNDPEAFNYTPRTLIGLEDFTLNNNETGGYNIAFERVDSCWIKGVESTFATTNSLNIAWSKNCEIRKNYFHEMTAYGVTSYGIDLQVSSDALIEDNIFYRFTTAILPRYGSSGCVIAYNYLLDMQFGGDWMAAALVPNHAGHPQYNLYEGNFCTQIYSDNTHGTSSDNTFFRNRVYGWQEVLGDEPEPGQSGKSSNTIAIAFQAFNRNGNVVGNVLGYQGYHTFYDQSIQSGNSDWHSIYRLAYDEYNPGTPDNTVISSLTRKGNYNYANDAIPAGESLSGDTLVASWYQSSKPSWFGILPWPPVDTSSLAQSDDPESIPAGYRFINGQDPPPEDTAQRTKVFNVRRLVGCRRINA
jgi:hypothetical protein